MTVNYTTNLSLGQPVTGTESGTWGDDVNNSITSYLDIAIAGALPLTSANFTAGALTLANTQGTNTATNISSTTAQYMAIRVSSLATNSTITAPSHSKVYLIDNADSTYTLTIKATGQTGYTVAAGTRAWVYYNGTDYVMASTNDVNKLIGPINVANGGTGQTSFTTYGLIAGGTTSTGALQQVSGTGTLGQALLSNGAGALPSFQNIPSSMVYPGAGIPVSTGSAWGTSFNNSGTPITVAYGGTGQSSFTDGQLLIGNSTGNTLAKSTLTAGAGIIVTNGSGSITISSSGGVGSTLYLYSNFGGF